MNPIGLKAKAYRILFRAGSSVAPAMAAKVLEKRFLTPHRHSRPEWEEVLAGSATVSWLSTRAGKPFPVYRWGTGPAVLLVHGWSSRGTQLGRFVESLLSQGFSVLSFDAPGHGLCKRTLTGLPEMIETVDSIFDAQPSIVGVVAHSLGTVAASAVLGRRRSDIPAVYIAPPEEPGRYLALAGRFMNLTPSAVSQAQKRIERRFGVRFQELNHLQLARKVMGRVLVMHDQGDKEVAPEEGLRVSESLLNGSFQSTINLGHRRILNADDVVAMAVSHLAA